MPLQHPKFAHKISDDDSHTSIQPFLGWEQAEEFFISAVPIITAHFSEEELNGIISGLKSSSAPSPVDPNPTPSSRGVPPCCLH